jgi:hypothetical protein
LAADAAWGVDALRAAGEPLMTDDDPVGEMLG